jgi:hypothetical protein
MIAVPRQLVAQRSNVIAPIDATFRHPSWESASWSEDFVDMASGMPVTLRTSAAVVARPDGLGVGFRIEEPFPTATVFERDGIVFRDNDVEVFIAFDWGYYELEINAAARPGMDASKPKRLYLRRGLRSSTGELLARHTSPGSAHLTSWIRPFRPADRGSHRWPPKQSFAAIDRMERRSVTSLGITRSIASRSCRWSIERHHAADVPR